MSPIFLKFVLPLLLFGLPASLLLLRVWMNRRQAGKNAEWEDLSFHIAVLFLFVYAIRWALVIVLWLGPSITWPISWIVVWPVTGVFLAGGSMLMIFRARPGEKSMLLLANLLFFGLALSSVIAPN